MALSGRNFLDIKTPENSFDISVEMKGNHGI